MNYNYLSRSGLVLAVGLGMLTTSLLRAAVTPVAPTITSFTPTHAKVGDTVTIYGTGFYPAITTVTFTGAAAVSPTSGNGSTMIKVVVPDGAEDGSISVTVTPTSGSSFGTAVSKTAFTVDPAATAPTKTISLSTQELDFGEVFIGTSAQLSFTITSTGTTNVNVKSISYPSGFTGNWSSGSIAVGTPRTIAVTFAPKTADSFGGTIVITCDATNSADSLTVSGMGQATRIISLTGNLAFGTVTAGNTKQLTLTIANKGTGPLTVSGLELPTGFSANWTSGTIAAGASHPVTVTFAPQAAGTFGGTLKVDSDATSGTATTSISGSTPQTLTKIIGLTGSLAFGTVDVGSSAQLPFTIANSGNTNLTVRSITYPSGFSGAWSGTIAAGGSHTVTVTFTPTTGASYTGKVSVASDATGGTSTLAISGTGEKVQPAAKTNWVQTLAYTLTGWAQNHSTATAISSKDIIAALSGATVNQVTLPTFPASGVQLLSRQALGTTNAADILVRTGTGSSQVDYNVSSAFQPAADVPLNAPVTYVSGGLTNYHGIAFFAFQGKANVLSFNLSGFMAASDTLVKSGNTTYNASKGLTATVSGLGVVGGTTNVLSGTVVTSGGHLE